MERVGFAENYSVLGCGSPKLPAVITLRLYGQVQRKMGPQASMALVLFAFADQRSRNER